MRIGTLTIGVSAEAAMAGSGTAIFTIDAHGSADGVE